MLPFASMISIDRDCPSPIYLQIANEIITHINYGRIVPGYKMPGTRAMSELLGVNRRTVTVAYEELEAQGWLFVVKQSGFYVNKDLPILAPKTLDQNNTEEEYLEDQQYDEDWPYIHHISSLKPGPQQYTIDAGYPDTRLAPMKELGKNLSSLLSSRHSVRLMDYGNDFQGDYKLRKVLVNHLATTRSITVDDSQLMITRGSLMAFYLLFQLLLKKGDLVIVGAPGFHVANSIIQLAGGLPRHIKVDEEGLDTREVEKICKKENVNSVFIMPHHHNPTTVSLSAERRMHLLSLADKYDFRIIEDDYDYDFHYTGSPILPMASSDRSNRVIYVGSLSKTVAPGLRLGYIVSSYPLIRNLIRLSRHIDCHGNTLLERGVAHLFEDGVMQRYFKKTLKQYHIRRDLFCNLLKATFGDKVHFQLPDGGLAVWATFDPSIDLLKVREAGLVKGLKIPRAHYTTVDKKQLNAVRFGFASLDASEAKEAIGQLAKAVWRTTND